MKSTDIDVYKYRTADHDIPPMFLKRWSPRAMSGEEVDQGDLLRLFEAARWAPSSMNNQPWRFLYARRNTPHWEKFFNLLNPGNQIWCRNAGVLIVTVSKTAFDFNGKPARTHSHDTGAAWGYFAMQGSFMGLVVHGMQGFNYDKAKTELGVGDDFQVEAMIAVGRPGDKEDLPLPVQEREFPSPRKKVEEFIFEGGFGV
jgi:nitroreductase